MNEKFNGPNESYCLFADDGITLKTSNLEKHPSRTYYFPYGSIKKVELFLGSFFIKPKSFAVTTVCTFTPQGDDVSRIKELIPVVKSKMKTAPKADVEEFTPEIRMKCNVCGNVFCYSISDVNESKEHENWAKVHSTMSLFSNMYGQQMMAEAEKSKVVDYTHCPSCHSTDLTRLADGEQNAPAESTSTATNIGIDEIKKFKELLDSGIITQEEFDAKKKQLLGL